MEMIGKCQRCGRGFLTMPTDGRDHYPVKRYRNLSPVECGGKVFSISTDTEPVEIGAGEFAATERRRGKMPGDFSPTRSVSTGALDQIVGVASDPLRHE